MKSIRSLVLWLTLSSIASGALAQTAADLLKEVQELKAKVQALEQRLRDATTPSSTQSDTPPVAPAWGMTPEQLREFNRVRIKTEALEDHLADRGYKGLTIKGMLDPTWLWTKSGGGGFAFLNGFSGAGSDLSFPNDVFAYDNSSFGQAMLDLQKETEDGSLWRLTLAPQKSAASGYNIGSIVHEASVSLPLTDNRTRLIAGQIPDWSGYEYAWSHQQPLITHNLLFDFTQPSFYTGAGLDLTRGKWWVRALIGNVNASRDDRENRAPVLSYRVDHAKGEFDGFGLAGLHGKSFGQRIDLLELDAYYIRGDWTLQGQVGVGRWAGRGAFGGAAVWSGLSALVGYQMAPRLKATVRADYLRNGRNGGGLLGATLGCLNDDLDADGNCNTKLIADGRNGLGPAMREDGTDVDPSGRGVDRHALSVGLSYLYSLNTTFKVEYRLDGASGPAFLDSNDRWRRRNHLFATSVVVSF